MLLSMRGHEVHVAYGSEQALSTAPALEPELILLDIGMPGLNGYEVCRQLRRRLPASSCSIVAVTGWNAKEDRIRSGKAGFDHHLDKPVDVDLLKALIEGLPACASQEMSSPPPQALA